MIADLVDELIDAIPGRGLEAEVAKVKADYFRAAGGLFGDEDSFAMQIGAFLEWFVLERQKGGKTFVEEYAASIGDAERKKAFDNLKKTMRGVFEVRRVEADALHLRDVKDGKKYRALSTGVLEMFKKGQIVQTRLFSEGNLYHLSPFCIFHHEKALKFITAAMKEAAVSDDLAPMLNRLAAMSLKRERYSKYDLSMIYKK